MKNMSVDLNLKRCPHCGRDQAEIIIEDGKIFVGCTGCGASSSHYSITADNGIKAFKAVIDGAIFAVDNWNSRII